LTSIVVSLGLALWLPAAATAQREPASAQPPLRVLLITGGGYHDYAAQKDILANGIAARANATFTVDFEAGSNSAARVSRHRTAAWIRDFDVVLYNICLADVRDAEWAEAIVREHVAHQVPAVALHCTMHSYNYRGDAPIWSLFLGVRTQRHQRQMPFTVEALETAHPVLRNFPAPWRTPQGELYEILDVYPTALPLAHAFGEDSKKNQIAVWTNRFAGVRVFGTTIGHHNETMMTPAYLDLVTAGLLWAANKLDASGQPLPGYEAK
jgi:type 1 glutamine amidotransferase